MNGLCHQSEEYRYVPRPGVGASVDAFPVALFNAHPSIVATNQEIRLAIHANKSKI